MSRSAPRYFELKAGGSDDPDGSRAASVLAAYFQAEHMRAFRRLLWRRLAIFGVVLLAGAGAMSLPARTLMIGEGMLAAAGAWAAVLEWRADHKLGELLANVR